MASTEDLREDKIAGPAGSRRAKNRARPVTSRARNASTQACKHFETQAREHAGTRAGVAAGSPTKRERFRGNARRRQRPKAEMKRGHQPEV